MSAKLLVLKESLVRFTALAETSTEGKGNWVNIIGVCTLKPVGYCCSKLKELGAGGGINIWRYETNIQF
jgi:hypothetical protein